MTSGRYGDGLLKRTSELWSAEPGRAEQYIDHMVEYVETLARWDGEARRQRTPGKLIRLARWWKRRRQERPEGLGVNSA